MGVLTYWWKSFASAGDRKRVATLGWLETPEAEPAESGGQVLVHGQRMLLVDPAGIALARFANDAYGTTTGVAPGATATLVSFTAATDFRLRGFAVTGTGGARISVQLNSVEAYFDVLSQVNQAPWRQLPRPRRITDGVVVALKVTNTGTTTDDFQGVVFGD